LVEGKWEEGLAVEDDDVEDSDEAGGRHANTQQPPLFVRGDDENEKEEEKEGVLLLVWEEFRRRKCLLWGKLKVRALVVKGNGGRRTAATLTPTKTMLAIATVSSAMPNKSCCLYGLDWTGFWPEKLCVCV